MEDIDSVDFDSGEIERNFAVQGAIKDLARRVNSRIDAAESRRQADLLVAEEMTASVLSVVEIAYLQRQENAEVMHLTRPSWQPDAEPEPSVLDTWVRGALQLKPPKLEEQSSVVRSVPRMAISAARQHRRSTADSTASAPIITSSRGRVSDVPVKLQGNTSVGAKKPLQGEGREIEDRLREEVQIRKRLQQKQLEMKQKDEEERVKLETLQKQLRGKEYGYDHRGQVLVLSYMEPEQLVAPITAPGVSIVESSTAKKAAPRARAPGEADVGGAVKPKQKIPLVAPAPDYVEERREALPSVIDTIKLASGCTVKQGSGMKKGPRQQLSVDHMTRKEFVDSFDHTAARFQPGAAAGALVKGASGPIAAAQAAVILKSGSLMPGGRPARQAAALGGKAAPDSPLVTTLRVTADQDGRPGWARDGVPRARGGPGGGAGKKPPTPDVNLQLTSQNDWGFNPAAKKHTPADSPTKLPGRPRPGALTKSRGARAPAGLLAGKKA